MTETVDKTLTWKATILGAAFVLAIPSIFPLGMFAWERYKHEMRWLELRMETKRSTAESLNQLCNTIMLTAIEQDWQHIAEDWSELCKEANTDLDQR
jgi:hypothetical protein